MRSIHVILQLVNTMKRIATYYTCRNDKWSSLEMHFIYTVHQSCNCHAIILTYYLCCGDDYV